MTRMTTSEKRAFLAEPHVGVLSIPRPDAGRRISLCAQTEALPYRYVSVEGPVAAIAPVRDELLPMAVRYLGEA